MSKDRADGVGTLAGVLIFLAVFVGLWFWTQGVWHAKIEARLAEWPAHQGQVTWHGDASVTPDGATEAADVRFVDYQGQQRSVRVSLPDYYRIGMTLPVRVHRSGAAYVPQAYYDNNYADPTKISAEGWYPGVALVAYGVVDVILSIFAGIMIADALEGASLPQLRGRLGTR